MKLLGVTNGQEVAASISHYDCIGCGEGENSIMHDGGQPHTNRYAGYNRSRGKSIWFEVPQTFAELLQDYNTRENRKYGIWKLCEVRVLNKKEWPNIRSMRVKAENFSWGTRGKNGDQPLTQVLLKDCESDHLEAILAEGRLHEETKRVIEYILRSRRRKKS